MKAVAWTDVFNVAVWLSEADYNWFALNALGDGNGIIAGFSALNVLLRNSI
jgi:hypothetical protein